MADGEASQAEVDVARVVVSAAVAIPMMIMLTSRQQR
jgi:hypothetical protein